MGEKLITLSCIAKPLLNNPIVIRVRSEKCIKRMGEKAENRIR